MDFVIQEALICRGSPTSGSENACKTLVENGLCGMFSVDGVFSADGSSKAGEAYPDNMKFLCEVMEVSRKLYQSTYNSLCENKFPITVGGDHSISIGTIAGAADYYGAENLSVVYIDGHADINTEKSTVTGYIHGMPLASSLGLCDERITLGKQKKKLYGKNIYIIGARSIDENEYPIIRENNVNLYTADDIRRRGINEVMDEVCEKLSTKAVHISFDVDFLDRYVFPATGYLMENGLVLEDARTAIKRTMSSGNVVSFDCVEYNPSLDYDGKCMKALFSLLKHIKK